MRLDAQVTITTTTVEDAATVIAVAAATTTVIVTQTIQIQNQSHATQTNATVEHHNSAMTLSVGQSQKFFKSMTVTKVDAWISVNGPGSIGVQTSSMVGLIQPLTRQSFLTFSLRPIIL